MYQVRLPFVAGAPGRRCRNFKIQTPEGISLKRAGYVMPHVYYLLHESLDPTECPLRVFWLQQNGGEVCKCKRLIPRPVALLIEGAVQPVNT